MSAAAVVAVDSAERARRTLRHARAVWVGAAGALSLALTVLPFASLGAWSQLALGRVIAAHGIPAAEPFSFLATAQPWVATGWLRDLLLAGLAGAGGLTLASLATAVAASGGLVLAALAARSSDRVSGPWLGAGVLLAALVARPFLSVGVALSLLGIGVVLQIVGRWRAGGTRALWLLPPVFLLWANLDPGFGAGLVVLVLAWAFAGARRAERRALLLALVASAVATIVNPSGPALYGSLLATATAPGPGMLSTTFASPDFHDTWLRLFEATAALLVLCWVAGGGVDRLDAAIGIGAIAVALWSQQFVPVFAVVAAPQLGTYARNTWERAIAPRLPHGRRAAVLQKLRGAALDQRTLARVGVPLLAIAVVVVVVAVRQAGPTASATAEATQEPQAAATRVATAFPGQRIYTPVSWGDYLVYRFPSGRVVFIYASDGSFTDPAVEQYAAIHLLQPTWASALRQSGVRVAIVGERSQEAGAFHELGWQVDCVDAKANALVMAAPGEGAPTTASGPLTIPPTGVADC